MFQWIGADNSFAPAPGTENVYRFAVELTDSKISLFMKLASDAGLSGLPALSLSSAPTGCALEVKAGGTPGTYHLSIIIPPASLPAEDDELIMYIVGDPVNIAPPCRVEVRRTNCKISTALIERQGKGTDQPEAVRWYRAALLWYSWRRFQEVIGLKRFTSGLSKTQVVVFRPRLLDPETSKPTLAGTSLPGVVSNAWGSYLLVKTGKSSKVREEWDRFQTFLADRLHPFMARSETYLTIRPEGETGEEEMATVIGSFLGGDLLQAEPFKLFVEGTSDIEECYLMIGRLSSIMTAWYSGSSTYPLGEWHRMFRSSPGGNLLLFGKYDLGKRSDRELYTMGLEWDIEFIKESHLSHHLLGKNNDGLLYKLMEMPVRYSLTHGDLHPHNILTDRHNVWLIDFGETGVAPTLFDFAKLEIYLRLWCLRFTSEGKNFDGAALDFESHLLDHLIASERSLEPVRGLADSLGARSDELLKIAHCISSLRQQGLAYSLGSPDRRDYLAILYLTVLNTLKYAGAGADKARNFRLLIALFWVLEDALSLIVGMKPFSRKSPMRDLKSLVNTRWLADPGGPARVKYYIDRADGQVALEPLAATRGVLQGQNHHLDVFDHTLLVLGYIEDLIRDPVAGLQDPAALDLRVAESLSQQGIRLQPIPINATVAGKPDTTAVNKLLGDIEKFLEQTLNNEARLILKWAALLHDVGKPATRSLTIDPKGKEKIQFLGHELYGPELIVDHLAHLFPDKKPPVRPEEEPRVRVESLIRKHLRPMTIVTRYSEEPKRLEDIKKALETNVLPPGEASFLLQYLDPDKGDHTRDFPLLILHGYADILACRGPECPSNIIKVAEINLVMLGLIVNYPEIKHRQEMDDEFSKLTKGFDKVLGIKGKPLGQILEDLKDWFMDLTCPLAKWHATRVCPSRDDLIAKARDQD